MTATRIVWPLRIAATAVVAVGWSIAALLLWRTSVPAGLRLPQVDARAYFSAAELERASDFETFLRIEWPLATLVLFACLVFMALRGPRLARSTGLGPIGTGIVLAVVTVTLAAAASLPFALAGQWWDRRHGLSRSSYGDALLELWLTLLVEVAFTLLVISVVMALARRFARTWWIGAGVFFVVLGVALSLVLPALSSLELEPLRRPRVAADARVLARITGAEDIPVSVEEVHEETTRANAYAFGLGPTRRVVLWDTLLDGRFSRGEIRVVLAHEFGHHTREHLAKGLSWFALFTFPGMLVLALLTRRRGGLANAEVVPYALLVLSAIQLASLPVENVLSRRYEAESDWVALEATRDPAAARGLFRRFSTTGLGDPDPPTWSYVLLETHPTLMQRIAMANAWGRAEGGGR